jgi:glycosyltransferase involved in cell wall biosynthesis
MELEKLPKLVRMKICVVNDHFSSGPGGQHRIQNLALGLSKLGHDVLYVSPYGISDNLSDLNIPNAPSYRPSVLRYLYPYFNDFLGIFRRLNKLDKKPDLLLIELPNTMSKSLNAIYGKNKKIPVALDFGGLWTSPFDKGGIYRNSSPRTFRLIRPIVQFYESLLALSSARLTSVITVPTFGMKILLEKFLGKKVHILHHPINTDLFNPKNINFSNSLGILPSTLKNKRVVILGVKDDPQFIVPVKEILFNYGINDVMFILMGNLPKLKLASTREGLNKFMFFTGPVPNRELPKYISVSKIAVALSNPEVAHLNYFPDNISKIVEYLAMGKPVITNTFGASDYIQNGENGFVCSSINVVIKRIVKLLDEEDLLDRMSQNARKIACEKFDYRKVASKYVNLLETYAF